MSDLWTLTAPNGKTWTGTDQEIRAAALTFAHEDEVPISGGKADAMRLVRALEDVERESAALIELFEADCPVWLAEAQEEKKLSLDAIKTLRIKLCAYFELPIK